MVRVDVGWTPSLLAIAMAAACGDDAAVESDESSDETSDSASTSTSATVTSSATSADSTTTDSTDATSTTGFDFGACYDPQTHPWSGPLCGSLATPCIVEIDERIDEHSAALAHGITLDDDCAPHVVYSHYGEAFDGFLASRTGDDTWSNVELPGDVAAGAIAWDTEIDVLRVLAYDGAGTIAQLIHDGDFTDAPGLAIDEGIYVLEAHGAASLGHGRWHVGVKIMSDAIAEDVTYAHFDGDAWTTSAVGPGYMPAAAVTPDDVVHLGYVQLADGTLELAHLAAGGEPTTIAGAGDGADVAIALVGTVPHLFFEGAGDDPNERRIALASSTGPSEWSIATLAVGTDAGCGAPTFDGETCDFDYFVYRPLDIVASHGGDVRLFYGEDRHLGSMTAGCDDMTGCEWTSMVEEVEGRTWIAAPQGDTFETAVLLERRAVGVDAAIDGAGAMHLVVSTQTDDVATIDYVRLGG